jgi:hypothetical protein
MTDGMKAIVSSERRPDHNIAMWGAPGSGKTTLLAALDIALTRKNTDWKIVGADPASIDYLIEKTMALSAGKAFPEASRALERYHWLLIGPEEPRNGLWRRKAKSSGPPRIGISLLDAPGGWFGGRRRAPVDQETPLDQQVLLDNLVQSKGIVFLFDPIREFKVGDAFDHLHAPLTRLAGRVLGSEGSIGGKLPHHIAVCITKFDDPRVLATAERIGVLDIAADDPHDFPRVKDEDAPQLFQELCAISASGNADMVLNALDKFFQRDRIKFFVSSSIGFYLDQRTNVFNPEDFQNLIPEEPDPSAPSSGQGFRIRGQLHPINVVEPMLWLGRQLAVDQAKGVNTR